MNCYCLTGGWRPESGPAVEFLPQSSEGLNAHEATYLELKVEFRLGFEIHLHPFLVWCFFFLSCHQIIFKVKLTFSPNMKKQKGFSAI